jgi:hypothetical protein
MRIVTGAPLCNPMPVHSAAARIVCSCAKLYPVSDEQITGIDARSGCGKRATLRGYWGTGLLT